MQDARFEGRRRGGDWMRFHGIDSRGVHARVAEATERTPIVRIPCHDERIALFAKLENRQVEGAFKARGAWNNVSRLTDDERARGVIATSSGNHGRALAWAAQRAGVPATIVMPKDAYPNKIAACREHGAEVVLGETREHAEEICRERVAAGAVLIHPYDAERTVEGAGTVGVEIAQDCGEADLVVFPVGGGGLIAGSSLALRLELGGRPWIVGVEPAGAPSMALGLAAGEGVELGEITTNVQGLCPLSAGELNVAICLETLDGVGLLPDDAILAAQKRLVELGEVVEPAGAAATAFVDAGLVPEEWLAGRSKDDPLRVVVVVSGGNPAPEQLAELRGERA